jgi:hypothetical protein
VLFDSSTELNIVECGPSEIRIRRFPSGIASSAIRLQGPIEQLVASQDGVVLVARTSSQLNVFINTGGLEFVPWENAFPMEDDDIVISSVRRHLRTVEVFVRKSNRIDGLRIDQSGRSLRVEGVLDQVSDCAVDGASLASISDTGQLSVPGLPSSVLNMSAEWSSIDCSNKDGVRLVAAAGQENGLGKLLVVRTENDASEVRTSEWDSPLASVMVPRPDYPLNGLSHVAANSVNQSLVWRWQDLEPSLIGESK